MLLSVMLHAGIVTGVKYGLLHHHDVPEADFEIEPVFFEILEESVIASASQSQPKVREPEPSESTEPAEPTPIESEVAPEADLEKVLPALENMVRTEFSEVEKDESEVRQFDEDKVEKLENPEEAKEMGVNETEGNNGDDNEAETPDENVVQENVVQEQDIAEMADVQQAKVVSAPMALNRIVPVYPRSARRRGREGVVTLEILVLGSGSVSKTEVVGSSGHSDLDAAAVSAVQTARFAPATEDGVQVEGRLRLTFEFRLK